MIFEMFFLFFYIRQQDEYIEYLLKELQYTPKEILEIKRDEISKQTCTIADVYNLIATSNIETLDAIFENAKTWLPRAHPAILSYNIFRANEKVSPNFLQGIAIRLQIFQNDGVRRITTHDDIDLRLPGEKKCAYFCCISDRDVIMRPISSLFFSFLFKDLMDAADRFGSDTRIPVNVILDEFVNLGNIPDFGVKIATARSRKIGIDIAFQSLGQIWEVYGQNMGTSILSCCDTTIFLGCNDMDTAKYVSTLTGEATIQVRSAKRNVSILNESRTMEDVGESLGEGKRMLYNPGETKNLDNFYCMVFTRSKNVMYLNKMDYTMHPDSKKLKSCFISDYQKASEQYIDRTQSTHVVVGGRF